MYQRQCEGIDEWSVPNARVEILSRGGSRGDHVIQ